jgi:hypothetical protein
MTDGVLLLQAGDIVIERRERPETYLLREVHGAPQLVYKTYDEALACAIRVADRLHVDVWYAENEQRLRRVKQGRT